MKRTSVGPARIGTLLAAVASLGLAAHACSPAELSGQTINGRLIDSETDQPIPLGLVMMYTEAGDSVTATISDGGGLFEIASPDPGSFVLLAAALGYGETPAGVFDLGPDGTMTVEYRLPPEPLPIDALLVDIDRPVLDHHLVRNGYVRRLQRGMGLFLTPYDIERSPARSTESLMEGIPNLRIAPVTLNAGGLGLPSGYLGQTIQIANVSGGWCWPTVYVDGIRVHYAPEEGFTLSQIASLQDVEAIEVYRRPLEVPVEFGVEDSGVSAQGAVGFRGPARGCGVLVVWTKQGLAPGQRPQFLAPDPEPVITELPSATLSAMPLQTGERVRLQLDPVAAESLGLTPVWEGVFATVSGGSVVVEDPVTGQPRSLPIDAVQVVQVSRLKDAIRRGLIAGTIFGVGMAAFLSTMCEFSCGPESSEPIALPSIGVGLFVGAIKWSRGPGREWVGAPMFEAQPARSPGALTLSFRVPTRSP